MKVLVFNCGSSSIKYKLFDMPGNSVLASGSVTRIGEELSEACQKSNGREIKISEKIVDHEQGCEVIKGMLLDPENGAISSLAEIGACGHRVVHGGESFSASVRIDTAVEAAIERYSDLAPIHNPPNLTGIHAAKKMFGAAPQVACFDTAFHAAMPEIAYLYGLPYEMYEKYGIRKYGFHGTSHRYVARRAAVLLNKAFDSVDLITCHLGNGSSITAVRQGKSVDTSMGMTPLEGLVMGTRTGDVDPAIAFFLLHKGYSASELDDIFNKKSGLLGISGISNDVRNLEENAARGNKRAKLALDISAYRIKKYIGSYLAVLNGADAIVFCGGIGENSPRTRALALVELDALGVKVDRNKNDSVVGREGDIATADSAIRILVIPTDEESSIAHDTYAIASAS
jgi:acetate kinase